MRTYEELEDFIRSKMSMTHFYQPVILKALLKSDDYRATVDEIAGAFLNMDLSDFEYYKKAARRWPKTTLVDNHKIATFDQDAYQLSIRGGLSYEQRDRLIEECNLRLHEFIDKNPEIKEIRKIDRELISPKLMRETLERSNSLCMSCGTRLSDPLYHVNHILPRSQGGRTVQANLQALCRRCNEEKQENDDIAFLRLYMRTLSRRDGCGMCKRPENPVAEVPLAYAVENTVGYSVIPNRHVESFAEMALAERQFCMNLVNDVMGQVRKDTPGAEFDISTESMPDAHCSIKLRLWAK